MGRPRVAPIEHQCEGCGGRFLAPRRDRRRYCGRRCAGSANTPFRDARGSANVRFNGGLSSSEGRTVIVHRDGRGWTFYYRAVVEAHLGRELRADEVVHHINGNPSDDRMDNLEVLTRAEHARVHGAERGGLNGR